MGTLPSMRAAVDPNVKGAYYYELRGKGEQWGHPVKVESNEASYNEEDSIRLWELSEKLSGVSFPI